MEAPPHRVQQRSLPAHHAAQTSRTPTAAARCCTPASCTVSGGQLAVRHAEVAPCAVDLPVAPAALCQEAWLQRPQILAVLPAWNVAQAWPAGSAPTDARSVANPCPILPHSAGYWRDWDGTPLDQAPLFYHDITPLAAETLEGIWGELRATNEALASALGLQEPPSRLQRIISAVMERYAAVVEDASTVLSVFQTNGAYHGFTHAVR